MGILLSTIFMMPYYLFGDPLIHPEWGVELSAFSIYSAIGGHLAYNFFLSAMVEGILFPFTIMHGIMVSVGLLIIGFLALGTEYYRQNIPFLGIIRF